jgi:hypothetical protein
MAADAPPPAALTPPATAPPPGGPGGECGVRSMSPPPAGVCFLEWTRVTAAAFLGLGAEVAPAIAGASRAGVGDGAGRVGWIEAGATMGRAGTRSQDTTARSVGADTARGVAARAGWCRTVARAGTSGGATGADGAGAAALPASVGVGVGSAGAICVSVGARSAEAGCVSPVPDGLWVLVAVAVVVLPVLFGFLMAVPVVVVPVLFGFLVPVAVVAVPGWLGFLAAVPLHGGFSTLGAASVPAFGSVGSHAGAVVAGSVVPGVGVVVTGSVGAVPASGVTSVPDVAPVVASAAPGSSTAPVASAGVVDSLVVVVVVASSFTVAPATEVCADVVVVVPSIGDAVSAPAADGAPHASTRIRRAPPSDRPRGRPRTRRPRSPRQHGRMLHAETGPLAGKHSPPNSPRTGTASECTLGLASRARPPSQ